MPPAFPARNFRPAGCQRWLHQPINSTDGKAADGCTSAAATKVNWGQVRMGHDPLVSYQIGDLSPSHVPRDKPLLHFVRR